MDAVTESDNDRKNAFLIRYYFVFFPTFSTAIRRFPALETKCSATANRTRGVAIYSDAAVKAGPKASRTASAVWRRAKMELYRLRRRPLRAGAHKLGGLCGSLPCCARSAEVYDVATQKASAPPSVSLEATDKWLRLHRR